MSKGNPFLALRLSLETIERLREASNRQGRSVSDLARATLVAGLRSNPATAPVAATVLQDTCRMAQRRYPRRRPSRIRRLSMAIDEPRDLLADYEIWQANQPEFATTSAAADKLEAAIEVLQTAIDSLEELELPRGFGRD